MKIDVIEEDGEYKKLRFNNKHEAWFPAEARVNPELWSEYLSVFWEHPANTHFYLAGGTPVEGGDICVDCGCCEGFFVFQALEAGAAKVIGIEPNPEMAFCLEKTFQKEIQSGRVIIRRAALGVFSGETGFTFDAGCPAAGQAGAEVGSIRVKVERLTDICRDLELPTIDFIKMDIEGAELQAIDGAMSVLVAHHPKLAICTYHRYYDYACIKALLVGAQYRSIIPVGLSEDSMPALLHARWA